MATRIELEPIGRVEEGYADRQATPKQGREGNRRAVIELERRFIDGLKGLKPGCWVWVLLWFDRAERDRLLVHPRGDERRPLTGVFNTRSPGRPNPVALDLARLEEIDGARLVLTGLDALTGTPVIDIKPYSAKVDQPDD